MLFFICISNTSTEHAKSISKENSKKHWGTEGTGRKAAITGTGHCWHSLPGNLGSHFFIKLCLLQIILQAKCNYFPLCILSCKGNVHNELNNCNTTLEANDHREASAKLVKPQPRSLECCLGTREALCPFQKAL